ncbi:hypothetical protein [Streptosporangium sp. CA-115845]|uniref:hypothetical protein n=1 Tax=Streptosporangium sp. CA-115845 TaxID=3240071 RepID=UPI003D9374BA
MTEKYITKELSSVIASRSRPGVTFWNRLEGRPRTRAFDRALRAEVRDALWMLTRQWQIGELRGADAGSPIQAKVRVDTTPVRAFRAPGDKNVASNLPPQAEVERLPMPSDTPLDLRLLMGRYWLKLLATVRPAAADAYRAAYPVHEPDPTEDATICAHPPAWSFYRAAATRLMDGAKLYRSILAGSPASTGIDEVAGAEPHVDALGVRFVAWFDQLISRPAEGCAWQPERMEYGFHASAGSRDTPVDLVAEEYFHGRIDWYNLDAAPTPPDPGDDETAPARHVLTTLPTTASFNGMPNTRWWTFEDGRTNFGGIRPDTTDLGTLMLIEFGLVYANDWFVVPFTVPVGTVASVRGLVVTDVFGERTWVSPAMSEDWKLFRTSVAGGAGGVAGHDLTVLDTADHIQESAPLDEVVFVRDEMANLVWAIEKTVPSPAGGGIPGVEAGHELRDFLLRDFERRHGHPLTPPPPAEGTQVRYEVMTSVPENWIPMIPMHRPGDNREIQLRRAAMPRAFDGDPSPSTPVPPRTWLLQAPGLHVHEEEVPRAGIRVTRTYRRTRDRQGRAHVWLGATKQTGRGEAASGLVFDRIADHRSLE